MYVDAGDFWHFANVICIEILAYSVFVVRNPAFSRQREYSRVFGPHLSLPCFNVNLIHGAAIPWNDSTLERWQAELKGIFPFCSTSLLKSIYIWVVNLRVATSSWHFLSQALPVLLSLFFSWILIGRQKRVEEVCRLCHRMTLRIRSRRGTKRGKENVGYVWN